MILYLKKSIQWRISQ